MPTAGEYRHAPSGIPCHCYVKRRLHHTPCRKSCLRKHSEISSSHNDFKSKRVTFNPILSVRSFDSEASPKPADSKKRSKNHARSHETYTICEKLTSLLCANHRTPSSNRPNSNSESSDHQKGHIDHNNNIIDENVDMNTGRDCPVCVAKRNLSPARGIRYGRARERTPSPCAFHQPYPSRVKIDTPVEASQYQRYASTSTEDNSAKFHRVPTPHPARYHSPRRLFRQDSTSTESSRTPFHSPDGSLGYENMDSMYKGKIDVYGISDMGKPSVYAGTKPDNRFQPLSIPITINDEQEDKMDEYIYEIPINNNDNEDKEYEYISIKSVERTQQSDPYPSKYVPSNFDTISHSSSILVRHANESDLTYGTYRKRTDTASPPLDSNNPNDKRTQPSSTEVCEEIEIRTETVTSQGDTSEVQFPNRRRIKPFSPLADILWMLPVALFWTGCALLVAMICAYLFPCDHC